MTLFESRPVGVVIDAPADEVYSFVVDPGNLPLWAAGLASASVEEVDGHWFADSPMGRVEVRFAPRNPFGVADHVVTLPDGTSVDNPLRILVNGDGAEVAFTVRRQPGMSLEQWDDDCARVAEDLETLRGLLEREDSSTGS
ncbi:MULTISPECIES: polyketide cyclase [unclassified Rathayibacter]|uniref:polyketide cyclase n=1 Tax=unclassified Rathayibacter TaxID=2609250 RepID=UPI0006F476F2|nr:MULTISPECIES: polyketide cyclase [unclassified Rathayibacter]KQQ05062.1 polyketide cyclase [Rathayibacter sp. Leaf294]KQS12925.1 polyketide cyclase [Rathayibacter sp. Leaf185]